MSLTPSVSDSPAKWVERFARIGLSAKGFVYCITGILAFMAAFRLGNASEKDAGREGVFKVIAEQPFGMISIAVIALGLTFFCVWRFIQAIKDTEQKGNDMKGIAKRAAYLFSGLVYSGVVLYVVKFLLDVQKSTNGSSQQKAAKEILQKPFGEWLMYIVAFCIAAVGIYQLNFALSGKYKKHVQQAKIDSNSKGLLLQTGKLGYIARGIVWLIIAWLFGKAGLNHNANKAGGTDSAFQWLSSLSYGSIILGAVAVGLICYGFFMFVRARFQPVGYK